MLTVNNTGNLHFQAAEKETKWNWWENGEGGDDDDDNNDCDEVCYRSVTPILALPQNSYQVLYKKIDIIYVNIILICFIIALYWYLFVYSFVKVTEKKSI